MTSSREHIELSEAYGAHNYAPLDVVIARSEGAWVYSVEGERYLDLLSAYSALNFGHSNPRFLQTAHQQLDRITLSSRAFYNDQFGPFCRELAEFCGMEMVLAMNSGAEAVETALKAARRWGYDRKGVPADQAEVICFRNNFAGRTISVISFSSSEEQRRGFGPFTPGFRIVPFGDAEALEAAITKNTVAVLLEPIQGEAGVLIPPDGFLKSVRRLCDQNRVLMIADEIQTGLCRTGEVFACNHEGVKPDLYTLGKSLGAGIIPISAVIGSRDVLGVFDPGSHGSTFGGNPLACAIARDVIAYIRTERPHLWARDLGKVFIEALRAMNSPYVAAIRGRGLMIGVDIKPQFGAAKDICKKLKTHHVLAKDTRSQTIRFAPALTISRADLEWGIEQIRAVFVP